MDKYKSLSHSKWECKYHVVFIPKNRLKTLYGGLQKHLGEVFRQLAGQKESRIKEGLLMPNHVHTKISIPATPLIPSAVRKRPLPGSGGQRLISLGGIPRCLPRSHLSFSQGFIPKARVLSRG